MNVEQLILEITHERDWRIYEIDIYRRTPFRYTNELFVPHHSRYWRMCIPMIYAHWEGFVISSFRLLTNYLNDLNLNYSQITQNLVLLDNRVRFGYLQGNCTIGQQKRFLNELFLAQQQNINFASNIVISAKSNLNYKQLIKILTDFDLVPSSKLNNNKNTIEKLVTFRNKIAHGENSVIVTHQDISQISTSITICIDEILLMIADYTNNQKYLK